MDFFHPRYQPIWDCARKFDAFYYSLPTSKLIFQIISKISELIDNPYAPDQFFTMISVTASLVMCSVVWKLIPHRFFTLRYLCGILFGVFVLIAGYQSGAVVIIFLDLFGYFLLKITPKKVQRIVFFVILFLWVGIMHLYEESTYPYILRVGIPLASMPHALRIIALSFNLNDGRRIKKKDKSWLHERNRDTALEKTPGFFKYMSFMLFFGNVTTVPILSYRDFVSSVERKEPLKTNWTLLAKKSIWIVYFATWSLILLGFGYHDFAATKNYSQDYSKTKLLLTAILTTRSLLSRLAFTFIIGEVACIFLAVGFNDKSGFEYAKSMEPAVFESTCSVQKKVTLWNMGIERWFRFNVYFRLPIRNRLIKKIITAMLAAYWHGFYEGFFAMIMSNCFLQIEKKVVNRIYKEGKEPGFFVRSISIFVVHVVHCYFLIPFVQLSMKETLYVYNQFYWIPHIVFCSIFLVLTFVPKVSKKRE